MTKKFGLSLAALLLLAGCGTIGRSLPDPTRSLRLPGPLGGSQAEEDEFRAQVENDPFPAASQTKGFPRLQ